MENEAGEQHPPVQEVLLKADEVDAGTTIQSPGSTQPLSALLPVDESQVSDKPKPPPRPVLKRDGSASAPPPPPPPGQPPPAPPAASEDPTDSLSLPQLRQLVRNFPKAEPKAFEYNYQDAQDFVTEIDEWFHYTSHDQDRDFLLSAREAFEDSWQYAFGSNWHSEQTTWLDVTDGQRQDFLGIVKSMLVSEEEETRRRGAAVLLYILSGVWRWTAGTSFLPTDSDRTSAEAGLQVEWIHKNVDMVTESDMLQPLLTSILSVLEKPASDGQATTATEDGVVEAFDDEEYREIFLSFSCFYIVLESGRSRLDTNRNPQIRSYIQNLRPGFLVSITHIIAQLRWNESYNIPLVQATLILWKAILLMFGDTKDHLEKIKHILQPRSDPFSADACKPILTASPLDYHLFRQEITSKYPAYNPPLPLIPLEVDQRSILPPLPSTTPRQNNVETFYRSNQMSSSIMHQPVHIATPAPSPPPSPGGPGGKGGKKQNYQTNQNFPFLYPPLDSNSNNIGGKGSTQQQDVSVGRRWEGSDVPLSILEAGQLFASRMRMTRAMRQLWAERDAFMKYDRGWKAESEDLADMPSNGLPKGDKLEDPDLQDRMEAVEDYFHHALPDFQSLVVVLMKILLTSVQDIATRNQHYQEQGIQGALNRSKSNPNLAGVGNLLPTLPSPPRPESLSIDDLNNIRSREVSLKAASAVIFLMLKWFKISHVLKFEYITQLLLDSSCLQLTLKYFAYQNLEELVSFRYDREDLSFWRYCQMHSDHPPLSPTSPAPASEHGDSDDDAVPPPIRRHRPGNADEEAIETDPESETAPKTPATPIDSPFSTEQLPQQTSPQAIDEPTSPKQPLVDELGKPLTDFPAQPLASSTYSTRHFQTSIAMLRILQKITRGKAHRALLLVSYKSAQILRRILRVPEPLLRLYTLKLFKSQVPYCGRKWRQSNMRVITAIYLHCRPELRDEWLAGLHDAAPQAGMGGPGADQGSEQEEALPLEWGLRGLTFWWMKRRYPDMMKVKARRNKQDTGDGDDEGAGQDIGEDERDFFKRELDSIGWGLAELGIRNDDDEVAFGEEAAGVSGDSHGFNTMAAQRAGQAQGQTGLMRPEEFGPEAHRWGGESPNNDFGGMSVAQGGAGYMSNTGNMAQWR